MQAASSTIIATVNRFLLMCFIGSWALGNSPRNGAWPLRRTALCELVGDTLEGSMKHLLRAVVIIAGVLLLAVAGLSFFFNVNDFRPLLEAELSGKLGREVKLGGLKMAI